MNALRLVLVSLLSYAGYRLLRWGLGTGGGASGDAPGEETMEPPVRDVLEEDPVCRTMVPRGQAIRLRHRGATYYFCSEACCDRFISQQDENT